MEGVWAVKLVIGRLKGEIGSWFLQGCRRYRPILEGTFSRFNLLIIGRLSMAGTDIGVCVMPGGIEVVSVVSGGE